jgi:hypothetical protein
MSIDNDLDILNRFVGDEPEPISNPEPSPESGSEGLDIAELIQLSDEPPAPVQPDMRDDDIETLKFRLQAVEIALDDARAKLSAAEKVADELAFFRHPNFSRIKKHAQAGGQIYLYPIGISQVGREAIYIAANQIMEIQNRAALEKYVPIFDVKIIDISTQNRSQ